MALIKLSAVFSDIRGKLAGSVIQQSKSGLVLKNISKKSKKQSNVKSTNFGYVQTLHNSWRNLTTSQKAVWKSFANFSLVSQKNNKKRFLSANELFFKLNFYRLMYGHSLLIIPEFSKCQFLNITATLHLSGSNLIFTTSRIMVPANEFLILKVTPPLLPSINSATSRMRNIIFVTSATSIFDISSEYLSVFNRSAVAGNGLIFSYTNANLLTGLLNSFQNLKTIL